MDTLPAKVASFDDTKMMRLAREVAMDIQPLEKILETHLVTQAEWDLLQKNHQFVARLRGAIEEWQSAGNTADRVKIKALAFVEEALPEFYTRAHDPKQPMIAKVEILKTVAKFAGVGGTVDGSIIGERLSVTINLGADQTLKIEKEINPKIIEGTAA